MQFVPSLPPLAEPVPNEGEVKAVSATAAPHRPEERTLPPLIYRPHVRDQKIPPLNRRSQPVASVLETDRRKQTRRIRNLPVLLELRASRDRRHHNQRIDDLTTSVDETI